MDGSKLLTKNVDYKCISGPLARKHMISIGLPYQAQPMRPQHC